MSCNSSEYSNTSNTSQYSSLQQIWNNRACLPSIYCSFALCLNFNFSEEQQIPDCPPFPHPILWHLEFWLRSWVTWNVGWRGWEHLECWLRMWGAPRMLVEDLGAHRGPAAVSHFPHAQRAVSQFLTIRRLSTNEINLACHSICAAYLLNVCFLILQRIKQNQNFPDINVWYVHCMNNWDNVILSLFI